MSTAMKAKILNLQRTTLGHHGEGGGGKKVLKHQRSKSIQNSNSNNNSTTEQNLSNNTNIRTCNATSNSAVNDNPGYGMRDYTNNTRTLNSKNSTPPTDLSSKY
jgi:hypothetical protein